MSRRACGPVSMPSVAQVSSPSALTPSTMAQTASRSRSFGGARPRPCRSGWRRPLFAARASASTASERHQLFGAHAGLVARALRAIGAILRAAAGLDRQQRGNLHLGRIEIRAVHALRAEHQFRERQIEQRPHLWRASSRGGRTAAGDNGEASAARDIIATVTRAEAWGKPTAYAAVVCTSRSDGRHRLDLARTRSSSVARAASTGLLK